MTRSSGPLLIELLTEILEKNVFDRVGFCVERLFDPRVEEMLKIC